MSVQVIWWRPVKWRDIRQHFTGCGLSTPHPSSGNTNSAGEILAGISDSLPICEQSMDASCETGARQHYAFKSMWAFNSPPHSAPLPSSSGSGLPSSSGSGAPKTSWSVASPSAPRGKTSAPFATWKNLGKRQGFPRRPHKHDYGSQGQEKGGDPR